MAISLTRLSGGNTPADGSDPRTFPAIWNASATAIEGAIAESGGGSITVSDTPPTDPAPGNGDLWWDSANGKLFVYYVDVDSSQWVDAAGPSVAVQSTAPTGYEGQLWLDDTDGSMYVYYTDPGGGASSWIGAVSRSGGILQVVSTTKTDTFTMSSTTFTTLTGLTATITPRSTSSKILVMVNTNGSASASITTNMLYRLMRDSTELAIGDASGSKTRVTFGGNSLVQAGGNTNTMRSVSMSALDSPSTTSSVTYSVDIAGTQATAIYVNRAWDEADASSYVRGASTITLMEIAG